MVMMFVEVERGGGEFVSSRVKSKSWYVSTVGIKFYGGHRYSEERCSWSTRMRFAATAGRNEKSCTCCALIRLQLYRKEESGTVKHLATALLIMKVLVTLSTLEYCP